MADESVHHDHRPCTSIKNAFTNPAAVLFAVCRTRGDREEELIAVCRARGVRMLGLEVRVSNTAAQGLYRTLGFRLVGLRRGYYKAPVEDALLMALRLD